MKNLVLALPFCMFLTFGALNSAEARGESGGFGGPGISSAAAGSVASAPASSNGRDGPGSYGAPAVPVGSTTSAPADPENWSAGPGGYGDSTTSASPTTSVVSPPQPGNENAHFGRGGHEGGKERGGERNERQACATQLGITLPAKGSGTPLSATDHTNLEACEKTEKAAEHAAMKACLQAAGVTYDANGRPTARPDHTVVKACHDQVEASESATATSTSTDTSVTNSTNTAVSTGGAATSAL